MMLEFTNTDILIAMLLTMWLGLITKWFQLYTEK